MKKLCGMSENVRGNAENYETISANIAIDDKENNIHIIIDGDIKDIEKFGQGLFDGVQKYIRDYMKVEYSSTEYYFLKGVD